MHFLAKLPRENTLYQASHERSQSVNLTYTSVCVPISALFSLGILRVLELMMMWYSPGCMFTCGQGYQRRTDRSAETACASKSLWEQFHWRCQVPDNLSWSVHGSSFQLPSSSIKSPTWMGNSGLDSSEGRTNVRRSLRRVARAPVKQAPEARGRVTKAVIILV